MMLLMYLMFIIAMNNKLNYSRYIITFNSYYLEMWATEWFLKWEIKTLVDKLRDKEEKIKKLKSDLSLVIKERDNNIKQNKKLKSDLAFKNTMLDNVKAEYDSLQNVVKKLEKENKKLKGLRDNKI